MVRSDWTKNFDFLSEGLFSSSFTAKSVLEKRYLAKDESSGKIETPEEMFWRVACNIASAEIKLGGGEDKALNTAVSFYKLMCSKDFLPNSPTLMNAGRPLQQLAACFVIPIEDSMESIFEAIKQTAIIHKTGGGTGFSFSSLRPLKDPVASTGGVASGPLSFMKVFNSTTDVVKQGGTRRGANMGILRVDHPDILSFITSKNDQTSLTNFNLSVAVTDKFMEALENDGDYELINPRTGQVSHVLRAGKVFELIVQMAWKNGEPGILFIDRLNRFNPTPQVGQFESTNPCGEQPLLPYESCNLGSVNLANMVDEESRSINWDKLASVVKTSVRFLDNVIEMNNYPMEEIRRMSLGNRKIGLGVMGFADMLIKLRVPYNSERGLSLADNIMAFIRRRGFEASADLASERGAFPNFKGSVYDVEGGPEYRNATITTIAPTGTISILAGCSSGIEPLFALSYIRRILDGDEFLETHSEFRKTLASLGLLNDSFIRKIASSGSIADFKELPQDVRNIFVVSHDISPKWHVKMQGVFQKHTDNAVSKTVNFPRSASQDDIRAAFIEAYNQGCKGITVYRDGSRDSQVLNLDSGSSEKPIKRTDNSVRIIPRERPSVTEGSTEKIPIGCGNIYVTVNFDEVGICEVFTQTGKGGGCPSQSEAVGRLVSMALRSNLDPEAVINQLRGIKCVSCTRKPNLKVQSCPDAISRVMARALKVRNIDRNYDLNDACKDSFKESELTRDSDNDFSLPHVCPECGHDIEMEGRCYTCKNCGYSKCG